MKRIVIVGGGLSGLAAAFRIREAHPLYAVTLLEAKPRLGGNIGTDHIDGFAVEHGPNGLFDAKPHALQLCHDLGLKDRLIAGSEASRKNRFLYLNGDLHRLPGSPLGLLFTQVLSVRGKMRMFTEPFRRRPNGVPEDESVAAFARRRFGRRAADVFVDALVTGIHAGDPERLSVAAAFPRLPMFEKEHGSVTNGILQSAKARRKAALERGEKPSPQRMWSFREGLGVLIDTLAARLPGVTRTGVSVNGLSLIRPPHPPLRGDLPHKGGGGGNSSPLVGEAAGTEGSGGWGVPTPDSSPWVVETNTGPFPADVVVLTTPADHQAKLLAPLNARLGELVSGIRYAPVNVAVLGYREQDAPLRPDGFGYIAPQRTRRDVLGVQWCSNTFPDRAPPGHVLWRALSGGVNRADMTALPDDEFLYRVQKEMTITMGVTGSPVLAKVIRWPKAIPQYELGHPARVAEMMTLAATFPGLILGGNAYHGVAITDCCEQAEHITRRV